MFFEIDLVSINTTSMFMISILIITNHYEHLDFTTKNFLDMALHTSLKKQKCLC